MDFAYISEDPETGTMMYDTDAVNRMSLLINSAIGTISAESNRKIRISSSTERVV